MSEAPPEATTFPPNSEVSPIEPADDFLESVVQGLSHSPRTLPCRFFYDTAGSELFERICQLPEYYPTRTEAALLRNHADEIIAAAGENVALVELGSGSSLKTRLLIEAALRRQTRLTYVPMDISGEFLRQCAAELLRDYPALDIQPIAAEYFEGIAAVPEHDGPRLFLFLGSNIGNFEPVEAQRLLRRIRNEMRSRDRLLLGVDLLKSEDVLLPAYNDAAGVTAAFNKNLLVRINRELGGDFDLDLWRHQAIFNAENGRIEMWLWSLADQTLSLYGGLYQFSFRKGEGIHTENSHKYTLRGLSSLAGRSGLALNRYWQDEHEWFAETLWEPEK
ncbi:MAG: L-histidine N(alpha)-methyltransferase [Armatimonadaceae bacterium]